MLEAINDYFEKQLEDSCHYTDTDIIFVNINVPLDSTIENETDKIKDKLRHSNFGKNERRNT